MVIIDTLIVKSLVQVILLLPIAVYAYGDGSDQDNCSDGDSDDKAEITTLASPSA